MLVRMFVLSGLLTVTQSAAASNYYAGFNLGGAAQDSKMSVIDNSLDPSIPNVFYTKDYPSSDESVSAYSVFVGYRLGADVAMEFGFVKTAEAETDLHGIQDNNAATNLVATETSEFSYNYLALVGVWSVGNHWNFNAKLGLANWQYDFRQDVSDVDTSAVAIPVTIPTSGPVSLPAGAELIAQSRDSYSDTGSDLFLSLGVGLGINHNFDFRAEVIYHSFEPEFVNVNAEQEVTLFFVGAAYHF